MGGGTKMHPGAARYALAAGLLAVGTANAGETDTAGFLESFKSAPTSGWHVAEYDFTHPHFDTDWRKRQVLFGPEGMTLSVAPQPSHGTGNRFIGGSIRREAPTGYGRYEATIQAAQGKGIVTGFFTYTGPAYGTHHDEIDIEFLGRDTTLMHVAWFVDGHLTNRFIPLGFDAAERPRRYAFDWTPNGITWYADGRVIFDHRAADGAIPTLPSRLFANIWAADPGIEGWAGETAVGTKAQAGFSDIRFTPRKPGLTD